MGKPELRRRFLDLRMALGPRAGPAGDKAQARLLGHPVFRKAGTIMVYLAFRGEVATALIVERALAEGKVVTAPVTLKSERRLLPLRLGGRPGELRSGAYGILEPDPSVCEAVPAEKLELVVVPGVAFDESGGRLGYGGGYYDRFLGLEATGAVRAALAYEIQMAEESLPLDAYDIRVDLVFTDRRVIEGRRAGEIRAR